MVSDLGSQAAVLFLQELFSLLSGSRSKICMSFLCHEGSYFSPQALQWGSGAYDNCHCCSESMTLLGLSRHYNNTILRAGGLWSFGEIPCLSRQYL